ncbi:hypothetical protein ACHAXM_006410 [Skeletonema potamos]
MNSFLSGIIDCVARPSTSDTPVRVLRKCDPCNSPSTEATEFDDASDLSSVSSAFEEAFAEFLSKNPAFSSMSYITLTRLREKLRVQSAKNVEVEAELRIRLEQLKETNRRTELMLQKELLAASNSKSIREAELLKHIQQSRDDRADARRYRSSLLTYPTGRMVSPSYVGYSPMQARYQPSIWETPYEEVDYQDGIRRSKMEQAHLIAEMEKIKQEKMKREILILLENAKV